MAPTESDSDPESGVGVDTDADADTDPGPGPDLDLDLETLLRVVGGVALLGGAGLVAYGFLGPELDAVAALAGVFVGAVGATLLAAGVALPRLEARDGTLGGGGAGPTSEDGEDGDGPGA
jgi:hypothetical protein